jgi:hypothetical protein
LQAGSITVEDIIGNDPAHNHKTETASRRVVISEVKLFKNMRPGLNCARVTVINQEPIEISMDD